MTKIYNVHIIWTFRNETKDFEYKKVIQINEIREINNLKNSILKFFYADAKLIGLEIVDLHITEISIISQ